jgi:hypothetical protein
MRIVSPNDPAYVIISSAFEYKAIQITSSLGSGSSASDHSAGHVDGGLASFSLVFHLTSKLGFLQSRYLLTDPSHIGSEAQLAIFDTGIL